MEPYSDPPESARLTATEVEALIDRVILGGERCKSDYSEFQDSSRPLPERYVLQLEPAVLQEYANVRSGAGIEIITAIELEYNDPYSIEPGAPLMPAAVHVALTSVVASEIDPSAVVNKYVSYLLPYRTSETPRVREEYCDDMGRYVGFIARTELQVIEDREREARPLTDTDVRLLRRLI